jgi:hypothetical protein
MGIHNVTNEYAMRTVIDPLLLATHIISQRVG